MLVGLGWPDGMPGLGGSAMATMPVASTMPITAINNRFVCNMVRFLTVWFRGILGRAGWPARRQFLRTGSERGCRGRGSYRAESSWSANRQHRRRLLEYNDQTASS